MRLPAAWVRRAASGSPACSSARTSRPEAASKPSAAAPRPPRARWPRPPGSPACRTGTTPRTGVTRARGRCRRRRRRPRCRSARLITMPVPMPVETLTRHNDLDAVRSRRRTRPSRRRPRRSPSGPGRRAARPAGARPPGRRPSRAGSAAGWAGPRSGSTGPGRLRPSPHRSSGSRSLLPRSGARRRGRSGPAPRKGRRSTGTSIGPRPGSLRPGRSPRSGCAWCRRRDEYVGLGGVERQAAAAPSTGGLAGLALDDHSGRRAARRGAERRSPGQSGEPRARRRGWWPVRGGSGRGCRRVRWAPHLIRRRPSRYACRLA